MGPLCAGICRTRSVMVEVESLQCQRHPMVSANGVGGGQKTSGTCTAENAGIIRAASRPERRTTVTMRFNPNPRSRVRGIYIPPCGGDHGQETTYMNWCDQCREIAYQEKTIRLMEDQTDLLRYQAENLGYQPRRKDTPSRPPAPAPEKKIPSGGANVRPRSSSTS